MIMILSEGYELQDSHAIGTLQISNLYEIPQEVNKREKEIMNDVNPQRRNLTKEEVLVLNTCLYREAARYIVYNPQADGQDLWLDNID